LDFQERHRGGRTALVEPQDVGGGEVVDDLYTELACGIDEIVVVTVPIVDLEEVVASTAGREDEIVAVDAELDLVRTQAGIHGVSTGGENGVVAGSPDDIAGRSFKVQGVLARAANHRSHKINMNGVVAETTADDAGAVAYRDRVVAISA